MPRSIKGYGWRRDIPDHRDFRLVPPRLGQPLPQRVDLRPLCPPVYDQGELGSCTANAIGFAFEFELMRQKLSDFIPSRLFIYWNERDTEGDTANDSGAQIRDGMSVLSKLGVCPEDLWPYVISQFAVKPPTSCYDQALQNRSISYWALQADMEHLKACLADGFPFVFGISVFSSFETEAVAQTGLVPMAGPNESCLGGHAIACVGYDEVFQSFICRNSWGGQWGLAGYFHLPYEYVQKLGSDFWTLRQVA